MTSKILSRGRGAGGNLIWRVSQSTSHGNQTAVYYWNGPGSRLYLVFGDVGNPSLVTIDDSRASDSYRTAGEAEAALRRYLDAAPRRRGRGRRRR